MKNNNKILIVVVLIILVGLGLYLLYPKSENVPAATNPTPQTQPTQPASPTQPTQPTTPPSAPVTYTNNQYGFTFSLPDDWAGYSTVQETWDGTPNNDTAAQTGPKILIRNPNWTAAVHYEDIPILIFTITQWNLYTAGNFMISAAPIPATELARNNKYVFALPPRWDYDYSQGYQEADAIVQTNPVHPFDL